MNTTCRREYNVNWETLPAGKFRPRDHRFEWTRAEFQEWANGVAAGFGYNVRFLPIDPEDSQVAHRITGNLALAPNLRSSFSA